MKKSTRTVCGIVLVGLSFLVGAPSGQGEVPKAPPQSLEKWLDYIAQGQTTVDMLGRCREAKDHFELLMQEEFDALHRGADAERAALLTKNQQDWRAYAESTSLLGRDAYRGGTLAPVSGSRVYVRLLAARVDELKILAENISAP